MNKNRQRKHEPLNNKLRFKKAKDWLGLWCQKPSFEQLEPEE